MTAMATYFTQFNIETGKNDAKTMQINSQKKVQIKGCKKSYKNFVCPPLKMKG